MGWGSSKSDVGVHTEWTFTTANFSQYYVEFNQIYSLLLLLRLLRGPAVTLLPNIAQEVVTALENHLNEAIRWPEAVTFEELNLESPGSIIRILLRAAHDTKGRTEH